MATSQVTPHAGDRQHVPPDQAAPELHRLKIDAQPMSDLLSGNKTCEVRNDDRGFTVGDYVHLACADGRETDRIISHIQRGYGLPDGLCVLSYRADLAAPSAPAEVAGLVDRLQKLGRDMDRHAHPDWDEHEDVFAAVSELTALQAEIERLRARLQELGTEGHAYREGKVAGVAQMQARAEKAEAERNKAHDR
ncbi:DUF3850 domain-containing protein [Paracoccus sp. (in: a-proteobacteria)]|uniref:DUF3850 domain-containing protein n=1 Tax=Paracoccus sp. TaxID=267 RepID=UPI00289F4BA1|nr:DUF3850 domain-containing protein [Paracoccus sp. (in: a-proteobacteria)]